jgi:hypothetical protein
MSYAHKTGSQSTEASVNPLEKGDTRMSRKKADVKLIKVDITWSKRLANVTSLTGGHLVKCLDLGDKMELLISRKPETPE